MPDSSCPVPCPAPGRSPRAGRTHLENKMGGALRKGKVQSTAQLPADLQACEVPGVQISGCPAVAICGYHCATGQPVWEGQQNRLETWDCPHPRTHLFSPFCRPRASITVAILPTSCVAVNPPVNICHCPHHTSQHRCTAYIRVPGRYNTHTSWPLCIARRIASNATAAWPDDCKM